MLRECTNILWSYLVTLRPGDANEVVEVYRYIMQLRRQPAALVLSRQPLPTLDRKKYALASGVTRGAYVLGDAPGGNPEVILIALGRRVSPSLGLARSSLIARLVSIQISSEVRSTEPERAEPPQRVAAKKLQDHP